MQLRLLNNLQNYMKNFECITKGLGHVHGVRRFQ